MAAGCSSNFKNEEGKWFKEFEQLTL